MKEIIWGFKKNVTIQADAICSYLVPNFSYRLKRRNQNSDLDLGNYLGTMRLIDVANFYRKKKTVQMASPRDLLNLSDLIGPKQPFPVHHQLQYQGALENETTEGQTGETLMN